MRLTIFIIIFLILSKSNGQFREVDYSNDKFTQIRLKHQNLKTKQLIFINKNTNDTITNLLYDINGELNGDQLVNGEIYNFKNGNPSTDKAKLPIYTNDFKSIPYKVIMSGSYSNGTIEVFKRKNNYRNLVDNHATRFVSKANGFFVPIYRSVITSFDYIKSGNIDVVDSKIKSMEFYFEDHYTSFNFNEDGNLINAELYQYFETNSLMYKLGGNQNWKLTTRVLSFSPIFFEHNNVFYAPPTSSNIGKAHGLYIKPDEFSLEEDYEARIEISDKLKLNSTTINNYKTLREALFKIY